MATDSRRAFVSALVRDHGQRLRRFLAARLRNAAADVPDLVQEIYLRMLRMPEHEIIRSPQAYLFTVAQHVLYEHRMHQSATPESVQLTDLLAEMESYVEEDPATHFDLRQRLEELDSALKEISPRAYATFVLHRRYGYTLEEIGAQFGVSRPMVKKYLAKAVLHCRQRFDGMK